MKIFLVILINIIISLSSELIHFNISSNLNISQIKNKENQINYYQKSRHLEGKKNDFIDKFIYNLVGKLLNWDEKTEGSSLKDYIFKLKDYIMTSLEFLKNDKNLTIIYQLLNDFININNTYYNNIIDTILKEKQNLNNSFNEIKNVNNKLEVLMIFIKNKKVLTQIVNYLKSYPDFANLVYLFPIIKNFTDIEKKDLNLNFTLYSLKNYLSKYYDILIDAAFDFYQDYLNNNTNFTRIYNKYLKKNVNITIDLLKIFLETKLAKVINIIFPSKYTKLLYKYINENPGEIKELYNLLYNNPEITDIVYSIIFNYKNKQKIIEILFTSKEIKDRISLISIIVKIGYKIFKEFTEVRNFVEILNSLLRGVANSYLLNQDEYIKNELSEECRGLLKYAIIGEFNNFHSTNISDYFLYKLGNDSPKSRNDLLFYDNCLKKPPIINDINIDNIEENGVVPAFIMSTVDLTLKDNKNKYKNNTRFESNYYVVSFCLPQGKNNGNNNLYATNGKYLQCSEKDYGYLIKYMLTLASNVETAEFNTIALVKNQKFSDKQSLLVIFLGKLIPFYILSIPIIIYLFLLFCDNKKSKLIKQNNDNDNDNDIDDGAFLDEDQDKKNEIQEKEIANIEKGKKKSKTFKFLNKFFNFISNLEELFNFESEITDCNSTKGFNYIRGLTGISILLTIFGQIYFILYNLPMKDFKQSHFYKFINDISYILYLIGLRYSPRILFSCSGFTLSSKYLSFIDKESNYYFIKFIFRQFYKYLILVVFLLYNRHSFYYMQSFFFDIKPITEIFNRSVLIYPESYKEFILSLFTFNILGLNKKDSRTQHDLIVYFWMAFNEIFFFLFGTILLTIGYKFKLKIDYIIIALVILSFLGKILFFYLYCAFVEEIYSTLYYYMFDYGQIMINPIFNLSYFLIGMYFGLMNYTTQKGIIQLSNDNSMYNKIYKMLHNFDNINTGNNLDEIEEIEEDNKNYIEMTNNNNIENKSESSLNNKNNEEENINKRIFSQDYIREIKNMPFLISAFKFKIWHNKYEIKYCFSILLFFLSFIIILLTCSHYIFISYYENIINNNNDFSEMKKILTKLSLEYVITNKILNFIYLIDIDLVVFFIQWGFFILSFKQQIIIQFFRSIYWSFFNKFYFSFLVLCDITILKLFYQSETIVTINTFTLLIYFFIDAIILFGLTTLIYTVIELPLKKLFRYFIKKENIQEDEENNEDDYCNEEDEEDEE